MPFRPSGSLTPPPARHFRRGARGEPAEFIHSADVLRRHGCAEPFPPTITAYEFAREKKNRNRPKQKFRWDEKKTNWRDPLRKVRPAGRRCAECQHDTACSCFEELRRNQFDEAAHR